MSDLYALLGAICVVLLAELGDKTMISTAILALKTGEFALMLAVSTSAFILANVIPVTVAYVLRHAIDLSSLSIIASTLFIVIGIWLLLSRDEGVRDVGKGVLACFLVVFFSEMGDKTQFAVFSYSLMLGKPVQTLVFSALGYLLANIAGIAVIRAIGKVFPWKKIKIFSGALMISIGIWLLISSVISK
ncbi:MAG: TMEM165/GDT1 family protein [Desulfurococcaceae archaeon]